MRLERISTPEKEKNIPEVSIQEWIRNSGPNKNDDEEVKKWMKEKRIELNSGIIEIKLGGGIVNMDTDEENFGKLVQDPDAVLEKSNA